MKSFNYIIARPWHEEGGPLAVYYFYGSAVQFGTQEEANDSLQYAKDMSGEEYQIYKVIGSLD